MGEQQPETFHEELTPIRLVNYVSRKQQFQIVGVAQRQCRDGYFGASAWGFAGAVQSGSSMSKIRQVILIQADAAPKPMPGAPCNGCGVCCLLEPCPLGAVLSGRRRGACVAVRWHLDVHQYRCGALVAPVDVLQNVLPRPLWCLVPWLSPGLARLAKRWIAVGQGCDSTVEAAAPQDCD